MLGQCSVRVEVLQFTTQATVTGGIIGARHTIYRFDPQSETRVIYRSVRVTTRPDHPVDCLRNCCIT
jgi:hypothetical protein